MSFNGVLKNLRTENELTQKQLATMLNLSKNAICEWEKGRAEPDIENLINLSKIFKCSIAYLLDLEDDFGVKRYGENLNNLAINELNDAEKNIIEIYRKLPEQRQLMLCQTAKDYYRVCFGDDKLSKFKVGS